MFLDEAQEIDQQAINVLRGRFSLLRGRRADGTEWITIPKSMYSCNPRRNWIYNDFVKPAKDGKLPPCLIVARGPSGQANVRNVTFENVTCYGEKAKEEAPFVTVGPHAPDVFFKP